MTPEEWVAERRKLKREVHARRFHPEVLEQWMSRENAECLAACGNDVEKVCDLVEAAEEARDLLDAAASGEYTPDSFSSQPLAKALDALTGGEPDE